MLILLKLVQITSYVAIQPFQVRNIAVFVMDCALSVLAVLLEGSLVARSVGPLILSKAMLHVVHVLAIIDIARLS
jgi:hypothetical protein